MVDKEDIISVQQIIIVLAGMILTEITVNC